MDTSDPQISFDENGVCSHCHYFDREVKPILMEDKEILKNKLTQIVDKIKKESKKNEYDCIIGLSGGVDSSFMALKVKEFGLKPLVIHVDAGWNSEIAVNNIKKIVDWCKWELHTLVMDWEEMKDLQLAYLKSGVANQDVPQDHVFFAALYNFATDNSIKYIMSGGNLATEAIFPQSWHYTAMDGKNLKAIHKNYGSSELKKIPIISLLKYYFYYPFVKGMKVVRPLNYLCYDRKKALEELRQIGFKEYGSKHCESIFTKFFQRYYLPERYGYDKRRPHLSSQILSGQITREEALKELKEPLYDKMELKRDTQYIIKKLGISEEEFYLYMKAPKREQTDFPSDLVLYNVVKKIQRILEKRRGKKIKYYS